MAAGLPNACTSASLVGYRPGPSSRAAVAIPISRSRRATAAQAVEGREESGRVPWCPPSVMMERRYTTGGPGRRFIRKIQVHDPASDNHLFGEPKKATRE